MRDERNATVLGYDRLNADAFQLSECLTWPGSSSNAYLAITVRQLDLELQELNESVQYVPITADIPSYFPEGSSSIDFIRKLARYFERILSHFSDDIATKAHVSNKIGMLKFIHPSLPLDREKGIEYMRAAALHGNDSAIVHATLMLEGTHLESEYPIRLYLALLALCHSNRAMQILAVRWPSLYKLVRKSIMEMPSSYHKAGGKIDQGRNEFLTSRFTLYIKRPHPLERQLTLHEYLTFGAVEDVEKALHGTVLVSDWDETLPGLLHELSSLPDAKASSLVRVAYEKGTSLNFFAPSESPIMEGGDEIGLLQAPCSPLSSAIRRGKPTLALAIFCLHIEFDAPIVDFSAALELSLALLYHDISENGPGNSTAKGVSLKQIMSVTPSSNATAPFERRALHGGQYDTAYAKTLQVIVAEGFDPTEGHSGTCPLFLAFSQDDVISAKIYVEHIQNKSLDVVAHLNNPGNTGCNDHTALLMCIVFGSLRCFEFLLKDHPELIQMNGHASVSGLLEVACSVQPDTRFLRLLLEAGCDVMASSAGHVTPLHAALSYVNIPAADLIASHCSDEQLKMLLGRDQATGWTIFSYLLSVRYDTERRRTFPPPRLINSFRWLVNHAGAHFLGPTDNPCFYPIIHSLRPSSRNDQILDLELFGFLLDLYYDEMKSKRWESSIVHGASKNGHIEIVRLLIARGFDVDACSDAPVLVPEFSIAKDLTALDVMTLMTSGGKMPIRIRQGSVHDIEKWAADIAEIKRLLADNSKHTEASRIDRIYDYLERLQEPVVRDGLVKVIDAMEDTRRAGINYFHTQMKSKEPPSWPVPVPTREGNSPPDSTQQPLDSKATEDFRAEIIRGTAWQHIKTEIKKNMIKKEIRKNRISKKEEHVNPEFLQQNRRISRERKQRWHLPPDWDFIGFIRIKEDHGKWGALFQDCRSGDLTFQKPPLYSGEEVVPSFGAFFPPGRQERASTLRLRETKDSATKPYKSSDWNKMEEPIKLLRVLDMKTRGHSPAESALDYIDDKGNTIIHICAEIGFAERLELLLQHIPEIERQNNNGLTALQVAVGYGRLEVVRILLDHGAQPDRFFAGNGLLPLHISTLHKTPHVAQLLLKSGVNPDGESLDGVPALHFCLSNCDNAEMVQLLIDHGADPNMLVATETPLSVAVANAREASLKVLLAAGAAMNASRDRADDESLLHIAARRGSVGIAEILLDHGAEVNRRDRSLKTPILDAVLFGQPDIIRFLCSRDADPSVAFEFQFFRRTNEDGKIEHLFIHVGDNERVSAETVAHGEGDQGGGWEEWQPVKVA